MVLSEDSCQCDDVGVSSDGHHSGQDCVVINGMETRKNIVFC